MATTVTATQGGATHNGILLRVKVLTGISASPIGASLAPVPAAGTAPDPSITTTVTGSQVYAALNYSAATAYTVNGNTTLFDNVSDSANFSQYGTGRTTSATGTPGAVTVGATEPKANANGVVLLEILPSGTITEDASSPAVADTFTATAISTASFTPPAGSLLVAMVSAAAPLAAGQTMTVSDSGGLTWTQQVQVRPPAPAT